jgi:hypothetical protein
MSVDHATVSGFGFSLSRAEIAAILKAKGIVWEHDEPEYELQDLYAVQVSECGNCYVENGIRFLYHAKQTRDREAGTTKADPKEIAELKRMIAECKLDVTIDFRDEPHLY